MSKITVNETVSRSVSFENSQVDVQTALDRCFQFLEEERFDEAHVIIEQILNIEPNNTNAHFANFLYQFKLSCAEDVVQNFKNCIAYKNSVFYKRIKRGAQTELSKKLDFCLGRASEQLEKFRIEEERLRIEKERLRIEKEIQKDCSNSVVAFVICSALGIYCSILGIYGSIIADSSGAIVFAFPGIYFSVLAIRCYFDIIKKRKKLHDRQ